MSTTDLDLSVVIGFRDWGLDRLALSIQSITGGFDQIAGEVIVSDYGSKDSESVKSVADECGARYVRVNTSDVWSRAKALNAGLAEARGRFLACTDADMLFTPETMHIAVSKLAIDDSRFLVLQCRDLPASLDAEGVEAHFKADRGWDEVDRASKLRPRWGMGGFIVMPRTAFESIRGLDERMEIYGGEDIDLANRLRRAGYRLEWLEDPGARMYHIWHPPTRSIASKSERGVEAISRNRQIMLEDATAIRNLSRWMFKPSSARPPITVAIATYNRAETILDAVHSVLAQTMPDFELLILDDGSTDSTYDLLHSVDDPRMTVMRQSNSGVAAARNAIADASNGQYTVIQDSDDLMPPWRLEAHLENLTPSLQGNYGSAINFDDETGEMEVVGGKRFSAPALLFNSQVLLHGTMMLSTELLRRVRYDSSLRSGTDYNLNVRLAKLGVNLAHTGELHLLRRMHRGQMTEGDSSIQRLSSVLTNAAVRGQYGRSNEIYHRKNRNDEVATRYTDDELIESGRPYLPDHLVRRQVVASSRWASKNGDLSVGGYGWTARSIWGGSKATALMTGTGLVWKDLADLSQNYKIDRSEAIRPNDANVSVGRDSELLHPCLELGKQALSDYEHVLDCVYVALFRDDMRPTGTPDSLIVEADLVDHGTFWRCCVYSEITDSALEKTSYCVSMRRRQSILDSTIGQGN